MAEKATTTTDAIPLDHLVGEGPSLQTLWFDADAPLTTADVREPHRHDYHELFVLSSGSMRHRIDDQVVEHAEGSVLVVGRGQTHVLEEATSVAGVVVRFSEAMLTDSAQQASPGWLLVRTRSCVMLPPTSELDDLVQLLRLLDHEMQRPRDARSTTLESYYLSATLLIIDRWQGARMLDVPTAQTPYVELFQQFARLLEAEFAAHHDAGWYADQLAVSANHLAGVLTTLTGRSTKKLISDRIMTEAQRLLAHTNLTAQQVAYRLGYDDPLYFSRAFKQHVGEPPTTYRTNTGHAPR
jgi:AraC family transcriptional regulator, transcriptional activator of pobA